MKPTRLLWLAVAVVCLVASGFAETPAQRARRWRSPNGLREILMDHREAQGLGAYGHEKLRGLNEIRVTRRVTRAGDPSYTDSCEAKQPDRIRSQTAGTLVINTATFRIETDRNGELNRRPPEKYQDSVIAMCMIRPSKSATVEKVRLVGRERVNGKPAYHLLAMDEVGNYDEWIDAKDYTLVQRKQSGVILSTVEQWSDFRNISGLMVPFDHSTRNVSTLDPWSEDEIVTKLDFDPQIPDADFTVEAATQATRRPSGDAQDAQPQISIAARNGTVTAEHRAEPRAGSGSGVTPVIRKLGQGFIGSPSCSDVTALLTVIEERLEPAEPGADMRVTVTNTSLEDLWVERVNCGQGGRLRPAESKGCSYRSKDGWVILAAKYRDVRDAADQKVKNACSDAFDAALVLAGAKIGK